MTKLHLPLFLLLFVSTSWAQSATTIEEALRLQSDCAALTINGTNKSLPKTLNSCTHLQTLNYTNNGFLVIEDGLVMPSVKELNLSGTYINTWELAQISTAFPDLEKLSLSNSGLYFVGSSLVGFSKLESLDLSNNQLEVLPEDLQFLQKLKSLNLSNNILKSNVGPLGYLWTLESLDVSGNEKLPSAAVARAISLNKNLTHLTLDFQENTGEALGFLKESSISNLTLNGAIINLPKSLSELSKLNKLGFTGSMLITDSDKILLKMKHLKQLNFKNSEIPGTLVSQSKITTVDVTAADQQLANNLKVLAVIQKLDTLNLESSSVSNDQIINLQKAIPGTTILSNNVIETLKPVNSNPVPIVKAAITELTIEPGKPNQIEVENVVFNIPENAFLAGNGKQITGPIKLEITVYNDPVQIALAAAPMTFDNNGTQEIFSSQGMLRFDAFDQNGNVLQPNPDNLIDVSLPNLQPGTDGNLYFYNDNSQKWEDADTVKWGGINQQNANEQKLDSINRIDYKSLVRIEADEPLFKLKARYRVQQSYLQITKTTNFPGVLPKSTADVYRYYQKKNDLFRGQRFYIDTVVSMKAIEELILRNRDYNPKNRRIKEKEAYLNEPRPVWNVQITKDGDNDRLRMTFNLKDTTYSYPVTLYPPYTKANPTLRSSIKSNTNFEFERRMAFVRDSMVAGEINSKIAHIRDSLATKLKAEAIISLMSGESEIMKNQMNRLGFPLSGFGLTNCDFFNRAPVVAYAAMDSMVVDQDNVAYAASPTVRIVYTDQMTYIEQPSTELRLVSGSKEIGIMIISSTVLGIIDFISDKKQQIKNIRTINIEGKSPEEVNRLIYDK